MGEKTGISWCDATDNPIRVKNPKAGLCKCGSVVVTAGFERPWCVDEGATARMEPESFGWWCRKVSPECANCYAETWNGRMGNKMLYVGEAPELLLDRELLASWARKTKPKKRFVASMTDIFGEWVPVEWCYEILDAMRAAPLQTFQLLTKWADRMAEIILAWLRDRGLDELPHNMWPGITAGNQKSLEMRIVGLLSIPSPYRWISAEPMLGPMNFEDIRVTDGDCEVSVNALTGWSEVLNSNSAAIVDRAEYGGVAWIVFGGESGSDRRSDLDWFEDGIGVCILTGVAPFFKQTGEVLAREMLLRDRTGSDVAELPGRLQIQRFPLPWEERNAA